jgi:hypothetical protein
VWETESLGFVHGRQCRLATTNNWGSRESPIAIVITLGCSATRHCDSTRRLEGPERLHSRPPSIASGQLSCRQLRRLVYLSRFGPVLVNCFDNGAFCNGMLFLPNQRRPRRSAQRARWSEHVIVALNAVAVRTNVDPILVVGSFAVAVLYRLGTRIWRRHF